MAVLKYAFYGAIALSLLVFGGLFYLGQSSQSGTAPGMADGRLVPCAAAPNCVSSEAGTEADKLVEALPLASWDTLPVVIADMGGVIVVEDEDYIAAEFGVAIFGFIDDVEFRRTDEVVHVRSGSRVGYSDMGVNSARAEELRAKLGG